MYVAMHFFGTYAAMHIHVHTLYTCTCVYAVTIIASTRAVHIIRAKNIMTRTIELEGKEMSVNWREYGKYPVTCTVPVIKKLKYCTATVAHRNRTSIKVNEY